ncbi:MAG: glycosyltransferase family 39 protein [Patescibacteria group bacterium]
MLEKLKTNSYFSSNLLAAGILLTMFLVALLSSKGAFGIPGDSGTVDEIAHIPSGYSYMEYFDYRLNPEHPPLAKALAGLPLAIGNFDGPEKDWSWNSINQWEAGWYMLYETSNDPAIVLLWSRLPMMLLMIALGAFLFKWSRELFGPRIGLVVLTLFAFYPDVIAHGRLVTTDVAAALGYVITLYYFDKAITTKTTRSLLIAALAFGIAQLLKFSALLLFGVLFILVIAKSVQGKEMGFWKVFKSNFRVYFLVALLSLAVVWIVYLPFVWQTPAEIEHTVIEKNMTTDPGTLPLRNFLHLFENNPFSRAIGHYLLGLMLVIARVAGGNATFLMGEVAEKTIRSYFPIAWLIKTPLPIILLSILSFIFLLTKKKGSGEKWLLWIILTPIAVYWAFTLKGSLNIGIRHLLPTIPFVLLLIGWTLSRIQYNAWKYSLVVFLVVFEAVHTLAYYPQFIGYFNVLVPKEQRFKYMTDSSLDWGQDLLRLKKYIDENNINEIKVDYFGGSVPSYYIPQAQSWHSSYGPTTGWLAVSATFYQSSKLYGPKEGKWSYHWLDKRKPNAIIGGSILVFNITDDDLIENPPESPYPITKVEYQDYLQSSTPQIQL